MSNNTKLQGKFLTSGVMRRTLGWLVTIIATAVITWFSPRIFGTLIAQIGSVPIFLLGLAAIALIILAIAGIWWRPLNKHKFIHGAIIATALLAAFYGREALVAILDNIGNVLLITIALAAVVGAWLIDPADIVGWIRKRRNR